MCSMFSFVSILSRIQFQYQPAREGRVRLCPHLTVSAASGQERKQPLSSLPEPRPRRERQPDLQR